MPPAAASSRWCPTPEQLMILEEMYRGGIRTPNASQIQKITAHLSFYGKIEGKNVFYWFQNHKARDRQKLRRKLTRQLQLQLEQPHQQLYYYHHQPGHQFLNGSSAWQQFSYENSPGLLPQGGVAGASTQGMNYTWKMDLPHQMVEMEKSMMTTSYEYHDWMTMVEKSTPTCTRPLQTLELFPITTTNLKEECTTSKQLSA